MRASVVLGQSGNYQLHRESSYYLRQRYQLITADGDAINQRFRRRTVHLVSAGDRMCPDDGECDRSDRIAANSDSRARVVFQARGSVDRFRLI